MNQFIQQQYSYSQRQWKSILFRKMLFTLLVMLLGGLSVRSAFAVYEEIPLFADYEEIPPLRDPTRWPAQVKSLSVENAPQLTITNMLNAGVAFDVVWYGGDNNRVAVYTVNGVWFYDLNTSNQPRLVVRDLMRTWEPNQDRLAFSPDGRWFTIAAGYDKRLGDHLAAHLVIWDSETGQNYPLQPYDPIADSTLLPICGRYSCPYTLVKWLPDNTLIQVGGNKVTVWRHLPADDTEVYTYPPTNRTGYSIEQTATSADSRLIAVILRANISDQAIIYVWDIKTGEGKTLYADEYLPLDRLAFKDFAFTADGSHLQVTLRSGEIWQWDAHTLEREEDIPAQKPTCLTDNETETLREATQMTGERLVCMVGRITGFPDDQLRIKDLTTGNMLSQNDLDTSNTIIGITATRLALAFPSAVVGGRKPYQEPYLIPIWDLTTGQQISTIRTPNWPARAIFSPDETQVAVTGVEGGTSIWDVTHPDTAIPLLDALHGGIYGLAFSPDETSLMVLSVHDLVKYTPEDSSIQPIITDPKNNFRALASDDHKQFAIGDETGIIQLIDWTTQNVTHTLNNIAPVVALAFTPDGKTLAVIDSGGLRFWDIDTATLINQLDFNDDRGTYLGIPYGLNFSPDGHWLVYKDFVWRVEQSGQLVAISTIDAVSVDYPVLAARQYYDQMSTYDFQHGFYSIGSIGNYGSPVQVARISDQQDLWSAPIGGAFSYWQITTNSEHWLAVGNSAGSVEIYAVLQDK